MDKDAPGNSHKKKAEKKAEKKGPVIKGEDPKEDEEVFEPIDLEGGVVQKKAGWLSKAKSTLLGSDADSVVKYVAVEVLLPAVRSLIVESTTQAIEQLVFGETRQNRGPRRGSGSKHHFRYDKPSDPRSRSYSPGSPPNRKRHSSDRLEIDEIIMETRADADRVLRRMSDIFDQGYDTVSVSDLHEMLGLQSHSYTDSQWGWFEIRNAHVQQVRDGYILNLPDPEPIPTN